MSVSVSHITKYYGKQLALDDVCFNIAEGQVVGLLGPNGAGKSTLMKIMTTLLSANKGDVEICGLNIKANYLKVRRLIGYLPENNPLYQDMYINEYLTFIKNLNGKKDSNLFDVIEEVGLSTEIHKKIGELSKGLKQRVGLAAAILNNPKILILDEATTGLDPNQIIEIRNLIKSLSKDKTIIISSHILQEVEAICDRVIIINKGKIKLDCQLSEIKNLEEKFVEITR